MLSGAKKEKTHLQHVDYIGPSMNPALKTGDCLRVVSYGTRKIRIGDIILFRNPIGEDMIVHRVFSANSKGVKTRGDHNTEIDPWILQPDHIIGRVVSIRRNNKRVRVHGGIPGRIFGFLTGVFPKFNPLVSKILHPVYYKLVESGIVIKCVRCLPKTRILSFNGRNGRELQLFMGSHFIGRRFADSDQWQIKRPFRLVVDETTLDNQ